MEYSTFSAKLQQAFDQNGYGKLLSETIKKKLFDFSCLLEETNKAYNLTSITDEDEIILKHLLDSASICEYIPHKASLIDIGCGAGFPSLPIAIIREDVIVTSIDSTDKKVRFIAEACNKLSILNVSPISGRAEDYAKQARESFDVATSRAVARLNILDELCLPFVKVGGQFIAMKSSRGDEEYAEASDGIIKLGAKLSKKEQKKLSFAGKSIDREIFILAKESKTPAQYPRNYSQISKRPL